MLSVIYLVVYIILAVVSIWAIISFFEPIVTKKRLYEVPESHAGVGAKTPPQRVDALVGTGTTVAARSSYGCILRKGVKININKRGRKTYRLNGRIIKYADAFHP